jgi:hypothetical protein
MSAKIPNCTRSYFYKYFDYEGALKTLGNKTIRLSSPRLFNDPFDMNFTLRPPFASAQEFNLMFARRAAKMISAGHPLPWSKKIPDKTKLELAVNLKDLLNEEQIVTLLMKPLEGYSQHYENQIKKTNVEKHTFLKDLFVYCLTEDHKNLLMWSHYAQKHKGVVIKFDCIKELDNIFFAAKKVNYSEQFVTFGTLESWIDFIDGGHGIDTESLYEKIITTKSRCWEQEREWRIVVPLQEYTGKDYAFFKLNEREVSEIYLGCKMLHQERQNLIDLIRQEFPAAKIFEFIKSEQTFSLEAKQII